MLDAFLRRITRFRESRKMTRTAFGLASMGDKNFVYQLEEGRRSPRLGTIARVDLWMAAQPRPRRAKSSGSPSRSPRRSSTAPQISTGPNG